MDLFVSRGLLALVALQQVALAVQAYRHERAVDRLLDRVSSTPNFMLEPQVMAAAPSPEPPYISDLPYADARWNDTVAPDRGDDDE